MWSAHLRGHLFMFDRAAVPVFAPGAGVRLLLAGASVEVVRLAALRLYPRAPLWLVLPALLALALVVVPSIAGVKLSHLGLRPWRDWSATERSYFVQLIIIANVVFPIVLAAPLANRVAQLGLARVLSTVFVPYLAFGFYQELVYRGMVQSQLVRRWGAAVGVFVANVLYTFGPLHWYYFVSRAFLAVPMFASIFAIGLFFGILYKRSGNLWLAAVPHAIGNAYILWGVGPVR